MNILFITRKFPPSIGGMQKVAFGLYKNLSKIESVDLIKYGESQKWVPFVLPYILMHSLFILSIKNIDLIYLQDGLMSPLGLILKIFRKPVVITIHGLDITYKNKLYQSIVPKCIKKLDKVVCISNATKEECLERGIPNNKIVIIPNGINPHEYYNLSLNKNDLEKKIYDEVGLKIDLKDKKILVTVGRLVERKGIHWFVENVMPKLIKSDNDVVYLIAGDGPYKSIIMEKIRLKNVKGKVYTLGKVSDELIKHLYNASDIMVMPNIHVEGDMEGFGIVALESSSCGTPVVASNLEGIRDSVENEKNGFLVESGNSKEFSDRILKLLSDKNSREKLSANARKIVEEKFSWEVIAQRFLEICGELLK